MTQAQLVQGRVKQQMVDSHTLGPAERPILGEDLEGAAQAFYPALATECWWPAPARLIGQVHDKDMQHQSEQLMLPKVLLRQPRICGQLVLCLVNVACLVLVVEVDEIVYDGVAKVAPHLHDLVRHAGTMQRDGRGVARPRLPVLHCQTFVPVPKTSN